MKYYATIFFLFLASQPFNIHAANLEISDINGHSGLIYATIRVNNSPNPVSYLKIYLSSDNPSAFNNISDPTLGIAKSNVKSMSNGVGGGYKYFEIYFQEPIPKGFSGPLLKVPFYSNVAKESMLLWFSKLEGDIGGWSTKGGNFTYIEDDNLSPVAEAGVDRFVIGSLTMDGSKSYDSDGIITKWDWVFSHRTNPIYNISFSGKNVSLTDLAPGIYDIQLIVTDNAGLTNADFAVLGVSGTHSGLFTVPGDSNSDGQLGLEDVIYTMQVLSGTRN